MSDYGDGSDGTLNVTSGTSYLNLDQKYQFTTVNISGGATLSSNNTNGSVLYICATESITIDGSINLSGVVTIGANSWSVVIDSVSYSSPGVADGGWGGYALGGGTGTGGGGFQGNGFGGGGGGGYDGGNGGTGGNPAGSGGAGGHAVGLTTSQGYNGGTSAGGGGGAAGGQSSQNPGNGNATGGAGGSGYGHNGGNASKSTVVIQGAGGGGGGGGAAGAPGVNLVLSAPTLTISGEVIVSGTNGSNGGSGGKGLGAEDGGGGGGGGGGNAGNVYLNYDTLSLSGEIVSNGGYFGSGGAGGNGAQYGQNGTLGQNGSLFLNGKSITTRNILLFSSQWDIDQLVESGTVNIGAGITELYNFSSSTLPDFPVTEVQFQPTGSSQWFVPGEASTDGTTGNAFSFYFYVQNQTLYINVPEAGKARYFIWSDKVNY